MSPTELRYPIIAIPDLHGQSAWLDELISTLRTRDEWAHASLVFLGDLVDRGPDVKGTVQRVIDLIEEKPGSVCVMGNHDLALVAAAGLGGDPIEFWVNKYGRNYDHGPTFRSYLGRDPLSTTGEGWASELTTLREAIPPPHREFLSKLPWLAEAAGHLFLHNGLSSELNEPAVVQLHALRQRRWAGVTSPRVGTKTFDLWQEHYPVWLGADKRANTDPLPVAGKIQVVGHVQVSMPDVTKVRIRLDTTGGVTPPLTAAVFCGPTHPAEFVARTG